MTDHERVEGMRSADHDAEHLPVGMVVLVPFLVLLALVAYASIFVQDCAAGGASGNDRGSVRGGDGVMARPRLYSHWNQKARLLAGWPAERTEARVREIRDGLSLLRDDVIRVNGLDNPLMSEDARSVLLNAVRRDRAVRMHGKVGV
jgi:hypothetical protein